jgi:hypothetical protein
VPNNMPKTLSVDEGSYLSTSLPGSGELNVHATANDFGAQVADSMGNVAQALNQGVATIDHIKQAHQNIEATQYVSDAMMRNKEYIDKYMSDPVNYNDPNYSKNLKEVLDKQRTEFSSKAPNVVAQRMFNDEYNNFHASRMGSAFDVESRVKVDRLKDTFVENTNRNLQNWRDNKTNPGINRDEEMFSNYAADQKRIKDVFGTMAPSIDDTLRKELTAQAAYGVVDENPKLAKRILDAGPLEGRTRNTLEDAVRRAESAHTVVDTQTLETALENHVSMVQAGTKQDKIILDNIHSNLPRSTVEHMVNAVNDRIDVYNSANDSIKAAAPLNEQGQLKILKQVRDKWGSNTETAKHDQEVFHIVQQQIHTNIQAMNDDPTAYLKANNPVLKNLESQMKSDPQNPKLFQTYANTMLQFQGVGDNDQYLGLPTGNIHLLDKTQADNMVQNVMQKGPAAAYKDLVTQLNRYDPQHRGIVMNDLIKAGMPGEIWAVVSHETAPWIHEFVGALQNGKELRKVNPDKMTEFTTSLDTNTSWLDFLHNQAGDNFQRLDMVNGVHGAIETYALALVSKGGMKPQAAIDVAVNHLINEDHVAASVNGHSLRVADDVWKSSPAELQRRTSMLLSTINPDDVDNIGEHFPATELAGNPKFAKQMVRDIITQKGFPKMNPDGRSFSVYVESDKGGQPYQLTQKNGKPFSMQLSDLPLFGHDVDNYRTETGFSYGYGVSTHTVKDGKTTVLDFPKKTYPLATNWPAIKWSN